MKYLLYIGEQDKKIKELETELNQKNYDNMKQDESRQYKCFPYGKRFNIKDKFNKLTKTQTSNLKKRNKIITFNQHTNEKKNKNDLIKNTKELIISGEKVLNNKKLKGNKFLDKKGNYFISHPKLKYIKSDLNIKTWKTNELLDSLPKGVLKHKFSSKSQKNHLISFPSSLNQIMANLEKLRIHNDFIRIENEFKENHKI